MHSKLYVYEYTSKEKKVTCTYLGSSTRATHHSVFQRTSIALAFPIAMETVSKPSEAPSWAVQLQDHVWDVCRARAGGCDAGSYMFLNFCVDLFSRLEDCFLWYSDRGIQIIKKKQELEDVKEFRWAWTCGCSVALSNWFWHQHGPTFIFAPSVQQVHGAVRWLQCSKPCCPDVWKARRV